MSDRPSESAARLVAVVKVTGDSMLEVARRLEQVCYDLEAKAEAGSDRAEIVGSSGIVTVRPEHLAPVVDWRESEAHDA